VPTLSELISRKESGSRATKTSTAILKQLDFCYLAVDHFEIPEEARFKAGQGRVDARIILPPVPMSVDPEGEQDRADDHDAFGENTEPGDLGPQNSPIRSKSSVYQLVTT
jgi:hypothetical protein